MTSLAYTPPKPNSNEVPISPLEASGPRFPRLRMNGAQAEAAGLSKCALGDEYEVTIRIKAVKLGGDEYEMRDTGKPPAEFDVISADTPTKVDTEEDIEDEEEKPEPKKQPGIKSPKQSGLKDAYDEDEGEEE